MKEQAFHAMDVESTGVSVVRSEVLRKSLHFLVALVPAFASLDRGGTSLLLLGAALFYFHLEVFRLSGRRVPVISAITVRSSRPRDEGHFVLGPITLALGAVLSLFLFDVQASCLAIYSLAFGDGLASLVGRLFGRHRPFFLGGKSLEGSASCFIAVFVVSALCLGDPVRALCVAAVATAVEALPLGDWDNLVLPLSVGVFLSI